MILWNLAVVMLCLIAALGVAVHRHKGRAAGEEAPVVALVKRRRELRAELEAIIGDEFEAGQLIREEATRLKVRAGSVEAVESALERAKRRPV